MIGINTRLSVSWQDGLLSAASPGASLRASSAVGAAAGAEVDIPACSLALHNPGPHNFFPHEVTPQVTVSASNRQ